MPEQHARPTVPQVGTEHIPDTHVDVGMVHAAPEVQQGSRGAPQEEPESTPPPPASTPVPRQVPLVQV